MNRKGSFNNKLNSCMADQIGRQVCFWLLFQFIGLCLQLVLVYTSVNPVLFVLDLHMKCGNGPSTYVDCVKLSGDSSPRCKKCWLCLCTTLHSR